MLRDAALPMVAALFRPRKPQLFAHRIKQCDPRIKTQIFGFPIDEKANLDAVRVRGSAGRIRSLARCFHSEAIGTQGQGSTRSGDLLQKGAAGSGIPRQRRLVTLIGWPCWQFIVHRRIATISCSTTSKSIAAGFALAWLHRFLGWVCCKWPRVNGAIKGHSQILIDDGQIYRAALRRHHMGEDDLAEELRLNGIEKVGEAKFACLERSGEVSVIKKSPTFRRAWLSKNYETRRIHHYRR